MVMPSLVNFGTKFQYAMLHVVSNVEILMLTYRTSQYSREVYEYLLAQVPLFLQILAAARQFVEPITCF